MKYSERPVPAPLKTIQVTIREDEVDWMDNHLELYECKDRSEILRLMLRTKFHVPNYVRVKNE